MSTDSTLLPQHRVLITDSAISPEVASARGYRSVKTKAELTRLGFSDTQRRVPALLLPIHNVHGEIGGYQVRPDEPRAGRQGRAVKYEMPKGSHMLLDVPPAARPRLGNPGVPLFITEGIRKADSAATLDLCCIGVIGVWNWRGTNGLGGKTALPDWESIALNDRTVYLVFDSDCMTKREVHGALARLRDFLASRHAHVQVVYLPAGAGGAKVGLDDYLAAGHSVDDLLGLACTELRPIPGETPDRDPTYFERDGRLFWRRQTREGEVETQLANFTARITREVQRDDGAEQRRAFLIEAQLDSRSVSFEVSSQQFAAMTWPIECLGAGANLSPGLGVRDHARFAIQTLSGRPESRVVYTHTGWRQTEQGWVFLHAGGAIGPAGTVGPHTDTYVDLPGELARVVLPTPPQGAELGRAVAASLGLLALTGDDADGDGVMVPLLGATYRAVLGPCDLSVHLTGETGCFKSELAARAAQHFGAGFDRLNLLGWSSTANFLEAISFAAKDTVLVIDDFVPQGTTQDRARLQAQGDRIFRGAGNRAGRGRLRADGSPRPSRAPRGLVISTGEDVPQGRSCIARIVIIEVPKQRQGRPPQPGVVRTNELTRCQKDGAAGLYAAAMAGFVEWIAGRYEAVQAEVAERFIEFRTRAQGRGGHARDPEKHAQLAVGWSLFLKFAVESSALPRGRAEDLMQRVLAALERVSSAQAVLAQAGDPPIRFLELVAAAIASGAAHVADTDGGPPPGAESRWGWVRQAAGTTRTDAGWLPRGTTIGWVRDDELYLEPDAALKTAHSLAAPTEYLGSHVALGRSLRDREFLRSVEEQRGRTTVRLPVEGKRIPTWHFSAQRVLPVGERPNCPNRPTPPRIADPAEGSGENAWDTTRSEPVQLSHGNANGMTNGHHVPDRGDSWDGWDGDSAPPGDEAHETRAGCPNSDAADKPAPNTVPFADAMAAEQRLEDALRAGDETAIAAAYAGLRELLGPERATPIEAEIRAEVQGASHVS